MKRETQTETNSTEDDTTQASTALVCPSVNDDGQLLKLWSAVSSLCQQHASSWIGALTRHTASYTYTHAHTCMHT